MAVAVLRSIPQLQAATLGSPRDDPTTAAGVTSGMAVGYTEGGSAPRDTPQIWTYTITGGSMTSSVLNLMSGVGYAPL